MTVVISTADGDRNPSPVKELQTEAYELVALKYFPVLCNLSTDKFLAILKVCCDDTFYIFSFTDVRKRDCKA